MQTVQIDIQDDKLNTFLMIINNLKNGIVESIRTQDKIWDIENIEKNSDEYLLLKKTKDENNQKYTIDEAEQLLGLQ